jgi:hypothetical protein
METVQLSEAPRFNILTGESGRGYDKAIRLVNFSSGHEFHFECGGPTGGVMGACEDDRVHALALDRQDVEVDNPGGWKDVAVKFVLSEAVEAELARLEAMEDVDIILVPLPVISALKAAGKDIGKARTIIRAKRETTSGPGLIRCDAFGT